MKILRVRTFRSIKILNMQVVCTYMVSNRHECIKYASSKNLKHIHLSKYLERYPKLTELHNILRLDKFLIFQDSTCVNLRLLCRYFTRFLRFFEIFQFGILKTNWSNLFLDRSPKMDEDLQCADCKKTFSDISNRNRHMTNGQNSFRKK